MVSHATPRRPAGRNYQLVCTYDQPLGWLLECTIPVWLSNGGSAIEYMHRSTIPAIKRGFSACNVCRLLAWLLADMDSEPDPATLRALVRLLVRLAHDSACLGGLSRRGLHEELLAKVCIDLLVSNTSVLGHVIAAEAVVDCLLPKQRLRVCIFLLTSAHVR